MAINEDLQPRLKWNDVCLNNDDTEITGTMFLIENTDDKPVLKWLPCIVQGDPSDRGLQFDINSLNGIILWPPNEVQLYWRLQLHMRGLDYSPCFSFVEGGLPSFQKRLTEFVDLQEESPLSNTYYVKRKSFSQTTYRLPQRNRRSDQELLSTLGGKAADFGRQIAHKFLTFEDEYQQMKNAQTHQSSRRMSPSKLPRSYTPTDSLTSEMVDLQLPEVDPVTRGPPLTHHFWQQHMDHDGRISSVSEIQQVIYYGGIEPSLRPIVWKYLLGYFKWDYTARENENLRRQKHNEYEVMKQFWKSMGEDRKKRYFEHRQRQALIEKDVQRTDRQMEIFNDDSRGYLTRLSNILTTHTFYNFDLGYLQGMNDLLAIVITVIDSEADAFWCFEGLLDRMHTNFADGTPGLTQQFDQLFDLVEVLMPKFSRFLRIQNAHQMLFCFKWLIIHFKREFSYEDTQLLWETMWSDFVPRNFHQLMAASILYREKDTIMTKQCDMNQILRHVNGLTGQIPLEPTLLGAQTFYRQLTELRDKIPRPVQEMFDFVTPVIARSVSTSSIASRCSDHLGFVLIGNSELSRDTEMGVEVREWSVR